MYFKRTLFVFLFAIFFVTVSLAQDINIEEGIEEVTVWGRGLDLLGTADSASQGLVGYKDFSTRPLMRVGELVEVIPGMIATQHSGPGKANQYFLRGINLDHGSDFSARFDGMPVNLRTHAHGSGYLDLSFFIPEIIEKVEYRKGPYFSDVGDFSAAGAAMFKTYDRLAEGFVEFKFGTENDYRLVGANSQVVGDGELLYGGEVFYRDGPWDLEQDLEKFNGILKYTTSIAGVETRLSTTLYNSEWTSTDQIPLRAVESGLISRFGFIDPDLGGESSRFSFNSNFIWDEFDVSAYASFYKMNLFSNFTYFLNDPINGDEFEQEDQRWVYGLLGTYEGQTSWLGFDVVPRLGTEIRYDDIQELNLYNTVSRIRTNTVREDEVQEFSIALFGEAEIYLTEHLRTTLGLRWDYYDFDVHAQRVVNSGGGSDSLFQPKFGVAYTLTDSLELYGNYGIGFHSNDVRGAVISIDPVSGDQVDTVPALVEAEGAEGGVRWNVLEGLKVTFAVFWLELESELVFVGDAGTTEPNDATRRIGLEFSSFWQINEWLVLDAGVTQTDAEFKDLPAGENQVPDAQGFTASGGITVAREDGWTSSLRVRHFGDASLNETETVKKSSSTLLNFSLSKNIGQFKFGFEVLNLLDAQDDDISYLFESQLAGEPSPVEDIHFHPAEERAFKLSLRWNY